MQPFCCFDVFLVRPPQKFQVQAKIPIIRPLFPDYISISYDYTVKPQKFATNEIIYYSFSIKEYVWYNTDTRSAKLQVCN